VPGERHTDISNCQRLLCSPGGGLIASKEARGRHFEKRVGCSPKRAHTPSAGHGCALRNTQDFWQNLPGAAKVKSFDFEGAFGHTRSEASPNDVYR